MKVLLPLNPENATEEEVRDYKLREAARAIVMDDTSRIALLFVAKENYYKLPGGGIEPGEDRIEALRRECMEELGVEIKDIAEVGSIVEYRKIFKMKQTSYCHVAKVHGNAIPPSFTDEELENDFQINWMSFDDAMRALHECRPTSIEGRAYIVPRDIRFLEEAKRHLVS